MREEPTFVRAKSEDSTGMARKCSVLDFRNGMDGVRGANLSTSQVQGQYEMESKRLRLVFRFGEDVSKRALYRQFETRALSRTVLDVVKKCLIRLCLPCGHHQPIRLCLRWPRGPGIYQMTYVQNGYYLSFHMGNLQGRYTAWLQFISCGD